MSAAVAPNEGYSRESAVDAEIKRLAALPRGRLAAEALAGDGAREETLVHLVRLCRREGDQRIASALVRALVGRIRRKVARTISLWRLGEPEAVADEAIEAFLTDFYEQIFSEGES